MACAALIGAALAPTPAAALSRPIDTVLIPGPVSGRTVVAFGTHDVAAAPVVKRITVVNTGEETLTVPRPVVAPLLAIRDGRVDPFELVSETCSAAPLQPDAVCAIDVRMTPSRSTRAQQRGPNENSELTIQPVGKPLSKVRLEAWVLHPLKLSPMVRPPLRLGWVRPGRVSAPKTMTLFGRGNYEILGGQVILGGADADQFSIEADRCSNVMLQPFTRCTYDVKFAPTSPGAKSASVAIVGGGANPPSSTMTVEGTGLPTVATTLRTLVKRGGYRIAGPRLMRLLAQRRFSLGLHNWPAAGNVRAWVELVVPGGGRRVLAESRAMSVTGTGGAPVVVRVRGGARRALSSHGRRRTAVVRFQLTESDGVTTAGERRVRVSGRLPRPR